MGSFIGDFSAYGVTETVGTKNKVEVKKDNTSMEMTDFLMLMVSQLTNQTIDNTTDTNDMLNQMVQMSMIQALTNMTEASVTTYAASLVGKEVTIGKYGSDGTLQEMVGTVTGTGVSNGEQVIFVDGESYQLKDIMAVGRLPEKKEEGDGKVDDTTGSTPSTTPTEPGTETEGTEGENGVPDAPTDENGTDTPADTDTGDKVEPAAAAE